MVYFTIITIWVCLQFASLCSICKRDVEKKIKRRIFLLLTCSLSLFLSEFSLCCHHISGGCLVGCWWRQCLNVNLYICVLWQDGDFIFISLFQLDNGNSGPTIKNEMKQKWWLVDFLEFTIYKGFILYWLPVYCLLWWLSPVKGLLPNS